MENVSSSSSSQPNGRHRSTSFQLSNFVFTAWVPESDWVSYLERAYATGAFSFIVGQLELSPTTQQRHIQGYAELARKSTLRSIKSLFSDDTIHIERRRGSQRQAIAYCRKVESRISPPVEFGEPKKQGMASRPLPPRYSGDAEAVFRYTFGSSGSEGVYRSRPRIEPYSGAVLRSVREVPEGNFDSLWDLEGEAIEGLLDLAFSGDNNENLAGGGNNASFGAGFETNSLDSRYSW